MIYSISFGDITIQKNNKRCVRNKQTCISFLQVYHLPHIYRLISCRNLSHSSPYLTHCLICVNWETRSCRHPQAITYLTQWTIWATNWLMIIVNQWRCSSILYALEKINVHFNNMWIKWLSFSKDRNKQTCYFKSSVITKRKLPKPLSRISYRKR